MRLDFIASPLPHTVPAARSKIPEQCSEARICVDNEAELESGKLIYQGSE
jgi:hypothetical protein